MSLMKMSLMKMSQTHLPPNPQEWERCLRHIMPACTKVAGRKVEQTFAILDVQGVGLRHFTGEVKRLMVRVTSLDQDNYPEMLGHTCIINAPSVFKVIWAFAKPLLDARTQNKIEVRGWHLNRSSFFLFSAAAVVVVVALLPCIHAACLAGA